MSIDILEWLPEINEISEPKLRDLTARVWNEAVIRGGWTDDDLRELPFTLLLKTVPITLIEHTRAVTKTSHEIAKVINETYAGKVTVDLDYLLAGAILHDVGKLFEYRRQGGVFVKSREGELLRHPISGAAFAFKHGLPQEVIHIIAAHSKEGDGGRRTIEAVIVNHADFVNFDIFK
ncbi:MAG: HD domain-containing protein [Candidatus Aminicenantes bacterium]|nr:HD domain-containing protein [Candidatus Aminicenantes bacterium]